MPPNQYLSKLNPKHPAHFQGQEKPSSSHLPIEKVSSEPQAQQNVNSQSPTDSEQKLYKQALRETIPGTAILVIIGAFALSRLHNQLQEDKANNKLCDLHRSELRKLFMGLLITEGLMILCFGLGTGFRVRKAFWKVKGRDRTVNEKAAEVLAVLLPFYLGAVVGIVTLVAIVLGRIMAKGWNCTC
ncbi:hypothetical protein ONS95_000559 [Cadophora gregata]|uniref:uncharacterized protein n=1 Tax=Cadophora gregata TaxID=51156 RepID=UPI0026DBA57C|nr:uncharacterized protein ONS95_000559 [Cadophora gregata]KAK0125426.1 hypothetical protein ONS96_009268 [Cadophora gregata f. sp. sojae]KAK0128595.1 hypothetical protein ONS95_000559 [Cadophora gregata]